MRIGVDTAVLSRDIASSGSRLIRRVLATLEPIATKGLYALHPTGPLLASGRVSEAVEKLVQRHVPMTRPRALFWNQWYLPRQALHAKVDVLHCVYHEVPVLAPRRLLVTTTIHDLCGLRADCGYRRLGRARTLHLWRLWSASVRADAFLYVSSRTRLEYLDRFPTAHTRPGVVAPWFLEHSAWCVAQETIRESVSRLLSRSYFVAFAYPGPRKGTDILARSYDLYRQGGGRSDLVLMLSGISTASAGELFTQYPQNVHFVEGANDSERDTLLRNAVGFLFPSRCEGFGLPLLEALDQGTSPIAFAHTPAEEILGGAGVLARHADAADFALHMFELSSRLARMSSSERESLRTRARERAATFSEERYSSAVKQLIGLMVEHQSGPNRLQRRDR